jgi:hypothetical protein
VLFLASQLAVPQDSSLLRSLYGEPEFERFVVRPGIGLTVESGADGLACKMSIKPLESPFVEDSLSGNPPPVSFHEHSGELLLKSKHYPKVMPRKTVEEILDEVMGPGWAPAMHTQDSCVVWESGPYGTASITLTMNVCLPLAQVTGAEINLLPHQCLSTREKSAELHSRYGQPDADNFQVRPGIGLLVEYGTDGEAREMQIDSGATPLLFKTAEEILDESVPSSTRGKLIREMNTQAGWGVIRTLEYEKVTIGLSGTACPSLLPNDCREQVQHAGATFKRGVWTLPQ